MINSLKKVNLIFFRNFIYLVLSIIVFFCISIKKSDALPHEWVGVPKSEYGEQLWDKNSVQKNKDGSIRVFSKFMPKSTTDITQDILYTMDVNCSENSFRDVAVGAKEFNEFKNQDSDWKDPNGDKLILGVIDQVCTFGTVSYTHLTLPTTPYV